MKNKENCGEGSLVDIKKPKAKDQKGGGTSKGKGSLMGVKRRISINY